VGSKWIHVGFKWNRAPIGKCLPIFSWVIVHDGDGQWARQRRSYQS
jgi:hypothetical protein